MLPDLTTDAFINALRRFVARRGKPIRLFSDNGTNFVGAYRELGDALRELHSRRAMRGYLLCNGIQWTFNLPAASHMGGIWERMIRSVRRVFNSVIRNTVLNDSELNTVMCEVKSVINNRPITPVSDDTEDAAALTPNHLLSLGVTGTPPPAVNDKTDEYRRRWRFIQTLVNRFWQR